MKPGPLIGLTPLQLEAVLAHEIGHIKRYDYLTNVLQMLVETLLFYHPAVWWTSKRIRLERELCCDDLAVQFEDAQLTYAELHARSNQLADRLVELGVSSESLVGICLERSIEMVLTLFAVLKSGAAYVPLDPAYPSERLAFVLEDAGVRLLITQSSLLDTLPATFEPIDGDFFAESLRLCVNNSVPRKDANSAKVDPDNLAYVIYTSGSTGRPKGVEISHRALVNFLTSMQHAPGITPADTLLSVTTLSFDIAGLEIYLPLLNGARLVLTSRETALDGKQLVRLIEKSGATIMQATPATWRLLIDAQWQGDDSLRILCGGEALTGELAASLLERCTSLWNMYGPTETTIWSLVQQVENAGHGVVEIGVEPNLVDVEVLGAINVGDRQDDQLDFHIHVGTINEIAVTFSPELPAIRG